MKFNHITEAKLVDYTLGHLAEEEKLEIERHLFTCELCFAEWRSWQMLLTENEEQKEPSPYLKQKVMNSVERHEKRRKHLFMRKPAYAIISVCLLFIIWLTFSLSSSPNDHYTYNGSEQYEQPNPFEQEEASLNIMDLEQLGTLPATYYPNMIWVDQIENHPIVATDQGPKQLLDCQFIVVYKKQDWSYPTLNVQNDTEVYFHEEEDIYLRCVR